MNRMAMLLARKIYLPAFAFFAAAGAAVAIAFLQEAGLARILPFLRPGTAYEAGQAVFVAYLVFAWPFTASYARRRMAKTRLGHIRFAAASMGPPAALYLLMLPLFAVSGFYTDKGANHALSLCPAYCAFAVAVIALLRLKFYFEIRVMRMYVAAAFAACAGIPAIDFILRTTLGLGTGPFAALNPFGMLAGSLAEADAGVPACVWWFTAAWSGAALILASVPAAASRPPLDALVDMRYIQNEAENAS